jgi:membrane protein
MAAQLSYYFLLAFFPFLIFLSALLGFLPVGEGFLERFLAELQSFLPQSSFEMISQIVISLTSSKAEGLLTFGILSALWFGSLAFNGMISLLNQAYGLEETRSYLHTRSLAILVTVVVSVFLILSGILLFFGDWLIDSTVESKTLGWVYQFCRWLATFTLLNVGVQTVFYSLPAKRLPFRLVSPGGLFTVVGWIFGSLAFRYYVNAFGNFQLLWGSLGALIALMVWFYISSFCLILGGEIDSEISKMREVPLR